MKKKLLSALLILSMVLALAPISVLADDPAETVNAYQGTVTQLTPTLTERRDSIRTDSDDKRASVIEVSVAPNAIVPFSPVDESVGRNREGWWVGINIVAPANVKLDRSGNDRPNGAASDGTVLFRNNGDSSDRYWKFNIVDGGSGTTDDPYYMGAWNGPSPDHLASGKTTYNVAWYFNWDGNSETGITVPAEEFNADENTRTAMTGVDQVIKMTFELKDGVTLGGKTEQDGPAWPTNVTFGKLTQMPSILDDHTLDDLGDFTISAEASNRTLTVTGTANYISGWAQFNSTVEEEQSGHYLPIQISLPGNLDTYGTVTITGSRAEHPKVVEGFTAEDHGVELVMRLDDLDEKKFTVQYNNEPVYIIDCSGITLKAEADDGDVVKYKVTFDTNGGSTVAEQEVSANEKVTKPTDPTKSGYTFGGWYKEAACTTEWNFENDTVSADTTLYAKWNEQANTDTGNGNDDDDSYEIWVRSGIRHGSVDVSHWHAEPGTRVTITVDPESDYVVDWIEAVRESNGYSLFLSQSGRRYTFTMPASDVSIDARFRLQYYSYTYYQPVEPVQPAVFTPVFTPVAWRSAAVIQDIPAYSWAYSSAQWAYQNGYLDLTADGSFQLNGTVSHRQMWKIMAQWLGEPNMNDWDLTNWARQNGAAMGSPAANSMTRQDVVSYLYQCCFLMGGDVSASGNLISYADSRLITSIPAQNAWTWAVNKGIISGTADGYLNPNNTVSRGEFAAILMRLCQNI